MALQTRGGVSRYTQSFVDTTNVSPLNRFHAEYQSTAYSLESSLSGQYGHTRGQIGLQLQRDNLTQTDFQRPSYSMGNSHRNEAGVYATVAHRIDLSPLKLLNSAAVDVAMRVDHAETHKDSTSLLDMTHGHAVAAYSPKIGVVFSKSGGLSYGIHANYGKSFRLPPINALFWQGDAYTRGNPGLRPERAEHSEVGAEVQLRRGVISARLSSTYFHQYIKDLIVWAQGQGGAWQPYNLAAARLTGHEDAISLSVWDRALVLRYTNTITTSRNRKPGHVTYDKDLTFTPHYIQKISINSDLDFAFGGYSVRHVGRRYALENNKKYYDAYTVVDINVGGRLSLSSQWRLELSYDLANALDEDYVLIAHYPMPGREWRLGLKIAFGAKN
jgi:outer membrane cobalamin receptor